MTFDELKNPELQEKLKAAKTPKDLIALAKEEGVELSDKQLEGLSGGDGWATCDNNDYQDDWAFDVL